MPNDNRIVRKAIFWETCILCNLMVRNPMVVTVFQNQTAKLGIFPGGALNPFMDGGLKKSGEKFTQNIILGRRPTQKHHTPQI